MKIIKNLIFGTKNNEHSMKIIEKSDFWCQKPWKFNEIPWKIWFLVGGDPLKAMFSWIFCFRKINRGVFLGFLVGGDPLKTMFSWIFLLSEDKPGNPRNTRSRFVFRTANRSISWISGGCASQSKKSKKTLFLMGHTGLAKRREEARHHKRRRISNGFWSFSCQNFEELLLGNPREFSELVGVKKILGY